MSPSIRRDLEQLEHMNESYDKLMMRLRNPTLKHHERQTLSVSLAMLKECMTEKTRDVKRRMREAGKYL